MSTSLQLVISFSPSNVRYDSVILFPLGVMNVAAMAVITLLIFAEKPLPIGRGVGQVAAVALIAYGVVVLLVPGALPTLMPGIS